MRVHFRMLIWALTAVTYLNAIAEACASKCTCALNTTICSDPTMTDFPQGVSQETISLAIKGTYSQRSQFHALARNDLKSLTNLTSLIISHTMLNSVDENSLQGLSSLLSIDLSFNRLSSLPEGFFDGLSSLSKLILTGNQKLLLPLNIFKGPNNLMQLHLGDLGLSMLDLRLFDSLDQLRYLDLDSNELTSLPLGVASDSFLRSLTELDLSFNNLTYVSNATVPFFKRVTNVVLSNNPWQCTCELSWLLRVEFRKHIYPAHRGSEGVVCQGPEDVAYLHLALLRPEQLVCVAPHIVRCDQVGNRQVLVKWAASVDLAVQVEPQEIGATFQIHCNVTGLPFPFLSWKTPDGTTTIGSQRDIVGPQLDLRPPIVTVTLIASPATNGSFTLIAQNVYGVVTEKINIVVKVPSTTTPQPSTATTTTPPTTTTLAPATLAPATLPPATPAAASTAGPRSTAESVQKAGGGESGGGDLLVFVAVGCSGASLLLSAVAIGLFCRRMSKGGEQVKPCADAEQASGRRQDQQSRSKGGKKDSYTKGRDQDEDDESYGRGENGRDSPYGGAALSPGRLRLHELPPRQPSPIAWERKM